VLVFAQEDTNRTFALKRMTKTAALQCPEHVYCEQHISKNTTNAFCIRQYASFKVCCQATATSAPDTAREGGTALQQPDHVAASSATGQGP